MNKTVLIIIAILAFAAAGTMYYLGTESSRMDELLDFWYFPIPLGVIALIGAFSKKKTTVEQGCLRSVVDKLGII